MDNDTTHPTKQRKTSHLKPILIAIGTLLLVIAMGVATAMFLQRNITTKLSPQADQKPAMSAEQVTQEVAEKNTVSALSADTYEYRKNPGALIQYKASDKQYNLTVPTPHGLVFTAAPEKAIDDREAVKTSMSEYLQSRAFTAVDTSTSPKGLLTYKNASTVCQLESLYINDATPAVTIHQLACMDLAEIQGRYTTVSSLLDMYGAANKPISPSEVTVHNESDDSVSYTILVATAGDKTHALLYGTVDNNTEYIADLSEGDAQYNTSKFTITPETRSKISDPKYKGFLLRQIAGVAE